ncbi:arginyltransferase [Limibacillus halophilus]|uniref:Aspartate/glutamate leucyltransferase n=1 Tax=Limibacillus halophilus TaxID=1579333 RepID=A0A839SSC3_9PROT|nr:arginyltransferase [Limibacillus halophilus]MBB3065701.1 arginine-tRNA-protein transferase [Limibacillus halophilus]
MAGPDRLSGTQRIQPLHILTETPCPYLPGRMERKVLTVLEPTAATTELYSELSRAGFRRSQRYVYRPACRNCDACRPVRIDALGFAPTRSQKRIMGRNRDLKTTLVLPASTAEHFALFRRYLDSRHDDGEMSGMTASDYRNMVEDTPVNTQIAEFRTSSGKLLACLLFDWLQDGPSLVYSFFEPDEERRSLGTQAVLWALSEARTRHLPFVYLGYWIPECRKMAYKDRFQPLQELRGGQWRQTKPPRD